MGFRIADTFTESRARLTGEEQKAVKITAFDLQMHPAQPGMRLHKLDKARDPHFLSVRVSRDIRLIVRQTNEDTLLKLADHLPSEAAEALLELATGGKPHIAQLMATGADPFEHPDAQRRFRVMHNVEELERALAYPWEKWTIFLPLVSMWLFDRNRPDELRGQGVSVVTSQ